MSPISPKPEAARAAIYRTIWRWHFYAALFVMPMLVLLSLTGAAYLLKPQVERWEERHFRGFASEGQVTPERQVAAALAALPGARFHSYRLPQDDGDAALVHMGLPGKGGAMRDVFVSPQGRVVGVLDPEVRVIQIAHDLHGTLLIGRAGSWIVELAASWAIVMFASGLYLWWPKGKGGWGRLAGVLWPRLSLGGRAGWRDMHAVTGFWVSGLALVLLITGLPWADVWGSGFKALREEMGWVKGPQDWTIGGRAPDAGGEHAEHDHAAMMANMDHGAMDHAGMSHAGMDHAAHGGMSPVALSEIVARARSEHLAFPVVITPPGAPGRFGGAAAGGWSVRSDSQNRPLRVTITYDALTGHETSREAFADKHPIDKVVGYGVAWHEGQLFGLPNQLVGLATALALVLLPVTGFVMWRRRKPEGALGAPPLPRDRGRMGGALAILVLLALFLPLLLASLVAMLLVERLVLARLPRTREWLGL